MRNRGREYRAGMRVRYGSPPAAEWDGLSFVHPAQGLLMFYGGPAPWTELDAPGDFFLVTSCMGGRFRGPIPRFPAVLMEAPQEAREWCRAEFIDPRFAQGADIPLGEMAKFLLHQVSDDAASPGRHMLKVDSSKLRPVKVNGHLFDANLLLLCLANVPPKSTLTILHGDVLACGDGGAKPIKAPKGNYLRIVAEDRALAILGLDESNLSPDDLDSFDEIELVPFKSETIQ